MSNYLKKQFSEFRENQKIIKVGLDILMEEIRKKLIVNAIFNITFTKNNYINSFNWCLLSETFKFYPMDNNIQNRHIEEFILSLLRDGNVLTVILKNNTGQIYKGKNICELWGYRLVILNNICSLQYISDEEMFRYNTTNFDGSKLLPDESTIYCGPEGKIFGWEKI